MMLTWIRKVLSTLNTVPGWYLSEEASHAKRGDDKIVLTKSEHARNTDETARLRNFLESFADVASNSRGVDSWQLSEGVTEWNQFLFIDEVMELLYPEPNYCDRCGGSGGGPVENGTSCPDCGGSGVKRKANRNKK